MTYLTLLLGESRDHINVTVHDRCHATSGTQVEGAHGIDAFGGLLGKGSGSGAH